ncbi:MAG TPA: Maf family protein [Phycisphaerales bacterium]|nr:Maf family protein [Phycisphaerales bacterium]
MSGLGLPIVLASTSPRRRELLAHALGGPGKGEGERERDGGFTVVDPKIEDSDLAMGCGPASARRGASGGLPLKQWVASLAYLKARAGAERWVKGGGASDCLVIGADTLVDQDGQVLSKPLDAADAARMIRLVRNRAHEVLTGVALLHPATGRRDVYTDRAIVTVGDIGDDEIAAYTAGGAWGGKSGAYNLQERLDAGWPLRVEGDPGCVTGLPTRSLLTRLRVFAASLPKGAVA